MKQSNLQLNYKQEEDLLEYLTKRVEQLQEDNLERIQQDRLSWMRYHNTREDRLSHDSIFDKSNVSVPLTSLVVDHFMARAEDEITGTSPYFKFDAQGAADINAAEAYDKYFNWKIENRAETRERLEESYLHIFVQRAAIHVV